MQLFYAPELQGDHHTLSEQESKHCIKVLRMQTGDQIMLSDGVGGMYTGQLANEDHRRCEVKIIRHEKDFGKRNFYLHVAIAPTKNINRFEWFLEKTTEIGIDEITPLICMRSERRAVKIERLDKVIIAAMKQSIKAYHPILNRQMDFKAFVTAKQEGEKYIAYVEEGDHPPLQTLCKPRQQATILIGPEGDFSPEEVRMATANGYRIVSLGNSRLRTETAGVVACHTVALVNEG